MGIIWSQFLFPYIQDYQLLLFSFYLILKCCEKCGHEISNGLLNVVKVSPLQYNTINVGITGL